MKKTMTLNWKKIREFYSDRALLVLIVLIYFLSCFCSPVVSQFTCTGDVDCTGNQCCSTYGYCGTGPDYCRTGKKIKVGFEKKSTRIIVSDLFKGYVDNVGFTEIFLPVRQ